MEQKAAAGIAVTSAIASAGLGDAAVAVFGVSLAVVLAAFAGAMISLSFLCGQGWKRALVTIVSGTIAGAYLAPFILRVPALVIPGVTALPEDLDKPVAFLLGLAFQIAVPVLYSRIKGKEKES